MNETHKAMLIILDGWGLGNHDKADVISQTPTPYFDSLMETYPNSQLQASGENVGLPDGQMGNSEVGHLNIGAGRIVYQDLVKINRAIQDKSFFSHPTLVEAMNTAKENSKAIHFLGLVSPGGVHSMDSHLVALSEMAGEFGLEKVYIHALTDGRDTDPKSGLGYVKNLLTNIEHTPARLATLVGRYYSMDRDKRWDRVKRGYDLLVNGVGEKSQDIIASIEKSYSNNITDEFIEPILMVDENNEAIGQIQEGDVVVAFNFRTDRLRQMTHVLTQENMPEHGMKTLPLHYYTMTRYDDKFKGVNVIYDKENVQNSIGEILSNLGKTQLRIAETEKYAHVTFFFSGGREEEFQGESRIMVSSPKVATYDLQPEMSAPEVADKLVNELKSGKHDFVCLNFANGDMVGHTGIYEAIEKAVKTVDTQLQKVVETGKEENYDIIIIADHGNADNAVNSDGSPNTAHSLNPVPFIVITDRFKNAENGRLADVAPSLLKLMNLDVPEEMTGSVLIS